MNPAVVGYIPPPSWPTSKVFLENLSKFKTVAPVYLFSEHQYLDCIKISGSPEVVKFSGNRLAVNNLIFFTACRIAITNKVTHMLYLESDCRVKGNKWDGRVWDEVSKLSVDTVCAGTVVCYNPCNGGMEFAKRWNDLIVRTNKARMFPISTYGFVSAGTKKGASVFVNGALGVYNLEWMSKLFDLNHPQLLCQRCSAWDYEIGLRLIGAMGVDAFDVVGLTTSVYSGFGDVLTSEKERMDMLVSGKLAAVHQVKSNATI